jgi:hypothetical protein
MGKASSIPKRPLRPFPSSSTATISRNGRTERALTGPSRSSRTNPVPCSGAGRALRAMPERPASQRPTAACWGLIEGDGGAGRRVVVRTPTRPASLRYSGVVKERSTGAVLGGGRGERSLQSLAGPGHDRDRCLEPLGYPTWRYAVVRSRIERVVRRRFRRPRRSGGAALGQPLGARPGERTPRAEAEARTRVPPFARAMQLGE